MPTNRPLFRTFPALSDALPIIELGNFPTPIDQSESLAAELNCATFSIKHDEYCTPVYGGNKIRKLEFLLGDIQARGYRSVVTFGGAGSGIAGGGLGLVGGRACWDGGAGLVTGIAGMVGLGSGGGVFGSPTEKVPGIG